MGLNIVGFFNGTFGLAEAARSIVKSVKTTDVPVSLISADYLLGEKGSFEFNEEISNKFEYPTNLFCLSQETTMTFMATQPWRLFKNRYNIALWFWETTHLPEAYKTSLDYLDEIWVTTNYMKEHLSHATKKPIHRIHQPIEIAYRPKTVPKSYFNLKNRFTFLFCFDFNSIVERKNPHAVIKAFQKAFPDDQNVQVVIKSQNGTNYRDKFEHLKALISSDDRIIWIDEKLPGNKRFELIDMCDCYISLHRSEGLGLTMAEALFLGKPTIGTGYSGNLDFMKSSNSYLCSYELVRVGNGVAPYPKEGLWAEIDLDEAAFLMRHVYENPNEAKAKALRGQDEIINKYSPKTTGKAIKNRIEEIKPKKKCFMPSDMLKKKIKTLMRLNPAVILDRKLMAHRLHKTLKPYLGPVKKKIIELLKTK